jgi:hypothetical protein
MTWLHAQRETHLVEPATYVRAGSVTEKEIQVTKCRFGGDTLLESETEINSLAADFVVTTSYLVETVGGGSGGDVNEIVFPEAGDRITIDATGDVFEVSSEGADKVWRWSDPHRNAIRIHTHQVELSREP